MSTQPIWNPQQYAEHARFVTDLGAPLIDMLAPKPGERVLDVGCGDGVLTKQLLDLGCDVVGIDSSQAMVEAAKALGVHAQVIDGHRLPFHQEFDAVFSNAALHWMVKPDEALRGIRQALRPGGRLVAEFGGKGNLTNVLAGLHKVLKTYGCDPATIQPWYFPTAEEYRARLEQQGFQVVAIDLFPRPIELPGDITKWLEMFAQPFLDLIPNSSQAEFTARVRETLRPVLEAPDGRWTVDYVRLRCHAVKPTVG
ncbi:MAG: class I SAM-dependent methyltransferase [Nitrospira sp. LK70]|nr:class I SAM-dependent methyltransferase [Nitrospira sp. LK70]